MAAKRKDKKRRRPAKDPLKALIEKKAKEFLNAEKAYWEQRQSLRHQHSELSRWLSLQTDERLPSELSSTVWALHDGVAFVRHKPVRGVSGVSFKVLPWTLAQWAIDGPIIPLEQGDLFLGRSGFKVGLSNSTYVDCQFNDVKIPYAEFGHLRYGEVGHSPTIEGAILDFQLALLGAQLRQASSNIKCVEPEATIQRLGEIVREFESLLGNSVREEELQGFLKEYPFVLHPSAEAIPKKKLGEDFVTDFVLVDPSSQGPTYILVELERSTHPILTQDNSLAQAVIHALKQTRDWDVWLEEHKAYLQSKLPGFETPKYLVVIGRGHELDETQKKYLRSYNREWKNTELITYDDVLIRYRSVVERLKNATGPKTSC